MRFLFPAILSLALAGCMWQRPPVVRVFGGRDLVGRYIPPEAYASYAEGAYLEAHGQLEDAESAYRQALSADPDSAAIWTRISAIDCHLGRQDAQQALDRARAIDAGYAPLWREQARCDLSHGHVDAALAAARKAFKLDPDDEETSVLMAELLVRRGQQSVALRWLDALVARDPGSLPGWRALLSTAHSAGERPEELRAARALLRRAPQERAELERRYPEVAPPARMDRALLSGHIRDARRLALAAHLPLGELAVRAAELSLPEPAARLANDVLGADPDNANAWIARLVAADLARDPAAFNAALTSLGGRPIPPRPAAARLLATLLDRRSGTEVAARWRAAYGLASGAKRPPGDTGAARPRHPASDRLSE